MMGEIRADGTRRRPPRASNLVHADDEEEDADDLSAYQTYSLEGTSTTSSQKGDVKGFVSSSGIANAYLNSPLQEGDVLSLVLDLSANGSLTSLVGNRTTSTNRNVDNGLTLIDAAMSVNSNNTNVNTSNVSSRHSGCCHLLRNGELIYTFKGLDLEKRYVLGCHVGDVACIRIVKEKLYRSVNIGEPTSSRHNRSSNNNSSDSITSNNSSIRMNGADSRLYGSSSSREGHNQYNSDTDTVEGVYVQSWRQSQQANRLTNSLRHSLSNTSLGQDIDHTTSTRNTSNDNLTLDMLQELARQELGMSLNRSPQLNRPREPPRPNAQRVRQGQLLLDELQLQRQQLALTRSGGSASTSTAGVAADNDGLRRSLETLQAVSAQEYLRTSQERESKETVQEAQRTLETREERKSESKRDENDVQIDMKGDVSIGMDRKEGSAPKDGAADSKESGNSDKSNIVRDKEPWCCICLTNDKSVLLLPCRHLCVCPDCGLNENALLDKCPICRSSIEHRFRVFT